MSKGARFHVKTFGFPIEAEVTEYAPPACRHAWPGMAGPMEMPGRGWTRITAWLLEDLPGGRVRVLTQESQKGEPARELTRTRPNPMLNGHQDWLEGLAGAAAQGAHP